jgi:hypothetical protein
MEAGADDDAPYDFRRLFKDAGHKDSLNETAIRGSLWKLRMELGKAPFGCRMLMSQIAF